MKNKLLKSLLCLTLAFVFVLSAASGAFPADSVAKAANISCNVKFSKPAICVDVGDVINLDKCGVQFSADSSTVYSGISWTLNGSSVSSYEPTVKGVYTLVAKSGNKSMNVYVIAKNATDTEYVLYENDFSASANDFRVIEKTNGGNVSVLEGAYVLDGSSSSESYVRALLPAFLDSFGDAKIEAAIKITSPTDEYKWGSVMYRIQNGNYPYYQACLRYNAALSNGVEISQRNPSNYWDVYRETSFSYWVQSEYNVCSITANGTKSVLNINGFDVLTYANTAFSSGAFGFQTRGTKMLVDYVKIVIDGNTPVTSSCDVSFAKPAIRADIGETIDLSSCDVQFTVDSLYTSGKNITWKKDGKAISTFTPSASGVAALTATYGGKTKNVYVVTRSLNDGEYVLYYNDFSSDKGDLRVIQQSSASAYYDGAGNYVIDASAHNDAYGRVCLPSFLDEFGDAKVEARYKDTDMNNERNWSSIMLRMQNADFPYMQMCIRNNTTLPEGVEIAQRNEKNEWTVFLTTSSDKKISGDFNTYALVTQSNEIYGYINGKKVISYNKSLYSTGAMGLQAKGLKITVDYVKVTLGETTADEDTGVECTVAKTKPFIGCNVGQTVLLDRCDVQFEYGSKAIDGKYITWKKDGKVITEFSDTSLGIHLLTASYAGSTMNVYVVPKKASSHEYVIYEEAFNSEPNGFRVIEASNGGSAYYTNGTYVLNGSGNADAYVRVLLPSYLDDFGDGRFETSMRLTAPVDNSKWGSLMYRVQNGNFPYMQTCLRYDSTAPSGVEIAQRNTANAWAVSQNTSTNAHVSDAHNLVVVESNGKNTTYTINGTNVLYESNTPFSTGAWGMQVRGLTMIFDWVRIVSTSNNTNTSIYISSGGYVDVRDPDTGIRVSPAIITDVKTKADLENITANCPAIAIMNYEVVDGNARVTLADGYVSPERALDYLCGKVIPAFRIKDNAAADSLASFLKRNGKKDAYAVSATPSVLKRAYDKWKYIRGVADYSNLTSFDAEAIRYQAMAGTARVVILNENVSKETVTKIQDSYTTVWIGVSEGKTASVKAINKGPYGIITPNRAVTEKCYNDYYSANTIIRRVNVIGHRGNPSVAQENTVAGAQTAYSNGATMVENDIYLVADGVLMVMHDPTIDRTTNGSGNVESFTSTQLKQYVVDHKAGVAAQPIPTLEEFLQSVKGKAGQKVVIEIKYTSSAFGQKLANLINKYNIMDQIVIISFHPEHLATIRSILPGIPIGLLQSMSFDESNPVGTVENILEVAQSNKSVYNPGYSGLGYNVIRELSYRGLNLWPWTVNNQNDFDRLMIEGVGGITTDYAQWSKDFVENLFVNSSGRVIATTYGGSNIDVTSSAEFVVVEDNLGITYSNGTVNVPKKKEGGSASYFFRYKKTTPTGMTYYTVTDVQTVEVEPTSVFELKEGSSLSLKSGVLTKISPEYTADRVKAEFKYPVVIRDNEGNALSGDAIVSTGSVIYLEGDTSKNAVVIMKGDANGDGVIDSTDYLKIKQYFLTNTGLSGVYFVAADCDEDGLISTTDYMRLKLYFMSAFDLYA